jgi:glycine/D-amino acid oxidase-like deaminating enzyme
MSVKPKIVIIGGGIGGLTTAVALARQGLATEVCEQAPKLKEAGAGVGLWANTLWALEPIGLADAVLQLGERVARQGVKRPDGTWLMCYPEEALQKRWGAGFAAVNRADATGVGSAAQRGDRDLGPGQLHRLPAQGRQIGARWHGPAPRELNKPVQVMCGDADAMLRSRASRDTAAAIPCARLVIMPDVWHALLRAIIA